MRRVRRGADRPQCRHDLSARIAATRSRGRRTRRCRRRRLTARALAPAGTARDRRCRLVAAGAGAGHPRPRRSGVLDFGRRCGAAQQGRAGSAPGSPTGATSCSAFRSGGWCRWRCARGCRAGCCARGEARRAAAARGCSGSGWLLLLAGSTALEWSRLYRFEAHLPGHAGGVLGYTLGPASMRWLGFTGSGLLWIVALLAGMSLALRFSWLHLAERIGGGHRTAGASSARSSASSRRTSASAQQARASATTSVQAQAHRDRGASAAGAIEPALLRGAEERARRQGTAEAAVRRTARQQAAAGRPARRRAGARQETVSAETLEMTSRLIEKKLKDFGVEVRVVAASPGPGDHALRDRAGHRREGLADRRTWPRTWRVRCRWSRSAWSRPFPARTTWRWNCRMPSGRRSGCPRSSARRSTTTPSRC